MPSRSPSATDFQELKPTYEQPETPLRKAARGGLSSVEGPIKAASSVTRPKPSMRHPWGQTHRLMAGLGDRASNRYSLICGC